MHGPFVKAARGTVPRPWPCMPPQSASPTGPTPQIAHAANAQGISVSQNVREAALIRAVLDEVDSAEETIHTAHDLLAVAREVLRLAEVDPPEPARANARPRGAALRRSNSS
jgi:hypothetical protein